MDTSLKPSATSRQHKPVPATFERLKLDRGSQFAQILNKVTKAAAQDIKPQSAALAPLVKPRSHLELISLNKVQELPKALPAALEKIGKSRLLISNPS